jgi:hypothetical protein
LIRCLADLSIASADYLPNSVDFFLVVADSVGPAPDPPSRLADLSTKSTDYRPIFDPSPSIQFGT